jgi:ATP-dependent Clp protease ATP-binding subunit ClpA
MLSKQVEAMIRKAIKDAHKRGHELATVEHLCLALLSDNEIMEILSQCAISVRKIKKKLNDFLERELEKMETELFETSPSIGFQRVLQRAAVHVMSAGRKEVLPAHVFVSIFSEKESPSVYIFQEAGLSRLDIVSSLSHGDSDNDGDDEDGDDNFSENQGHAFDSEAAPSAKTNALQSYTINLTEAARKGELDLLVGRDREITRLVHILLRRRKNNPLLVGEAGVGKSAVIEGLAQRIISHEVPEVLWESEVYMLDMGLLLAGTRYRGDFENRLKNVIKSLLEKNNAILVVDEIHTIIGAGSTSGGSMDAANLLKPVLSSGKVRCVGSTTYKEFRSYFEKDRALARRFQKIDIEEPNEEDCIKILQGIRGQYESFHGVKIADAALLAAVHLSARYLQDKKLPDKAIDLVDEAAAGIKLKARPENANDSFFRVVSEKDIEETIARMAQIPSKQVSHDDKKILSHLEIDLKKLVFGQDSAIAEVVSAIKLSRAGLRESEKPIGSFLFSGPTGVGKTEVAKQLAKTMGISFLRFDMSEYMERHTVSRLVGAPPGYVGFEQGGLLTDGVHRTPHAVLLLDEIEKAHPDVFNMLLQIMDYGKLTDSNGRPTDFRHVILIMTSNVGAREMAQSRIGFGDSEQNWADEGAFKRLFSPEFRNRLDARIPFAPLKPDAMIRIVDKLMSEMQGQLAERSVTMEVSPVAKQYLAQKGFDKTMGARPLARVVQDKIKRPMADKLLFGELKNGGHILVDLNASGEIQFQIEAKV